MTDHERQIKEKMSELINRWKDKDLKPGSTDDIRRTIDRMIYRSLKRNLEGIQKKGTDIVAEAKKIFGV